MLYYHLLIVLTIRECQSGRGKVVGVSEPGRCKKTYCFVAVRIQLA